MAVFDELGWERVGKYMGHRASRDRPISCDLTVWPLWKLASKPGALPGGLTQTHTHPHTHSHTHTHAFVPSGSSSSYRQTYREVRGRLGHIFWQRLVGNIQYIHTHMQSYVSTWFTGLSCREWETGREGGGQRQTEMGEYSLQVAGLGKEDI